MKDFMFFNDLEGDLADLKNRFLLTIMQSQAEHDVVLERGRAGFLMEESHDDDHPHIMPGDKKGNARGPKHHQDDVAPTELPFVGVNVDDVPTSGITSYGNTFKLHSLPGSKFTVYLDFDGHVTTGTAWNSFWKTPIINSPAFSAGNTDGTTFTATELLRIQQIWQRMAEYFSPFNINVTTEDPGVGALTYSGIGDSDGHGIRVVITDEGGKNYGGIAYTGSFNWNSDTPVFVYANRLSDSAKLISDAAAHEVGHSLGLNHDGRGTSQYYYGHGSGVTDWAPIMGVGYNAQIVQWSKGDYNGSTNKQDDLSIITTRNNGVTYRADDHGNTFSTATIMDGNYNVTTRKMVVEEFGIISGSGARNDVDMFKFTMNKTGAFTFTAAAGTQAFVSGQDDPIYRNGTNTMLDARIDVYNSQFQLIATADPTNAVRATVSMSGLAAGDYYIAIDGVGWGDPMAATPTGYTEYGSLGQYLLKGSYDYVL